MKKLFKTVIAVLLIIITVTSFIACRKEKSSPINTAKSKVVEICEEYLESKITKNEALEQLVDIYNSADINYVYFRRALKNLGRQIESKDFDPKSFKEELNNFKKSDLSKTIKDISDGKYEGLYNGDEEMLKKPFVLEVFTDSMAPVINEGDFIGVSPIEDVSSLKQGDIIVYWYSDDYERYIITHRIIQVYNNDGRFTFKTKADYNIVEDEYTVSESDIIGVFDIVLIKA